MCYNNGQGVKEDLKKAAEWLTKAAEQGYEEAKMSIPKVLTKEIAEQFLEDDESVDLSEFAAIEDEAAESLSKHEGGLSLGGLTSLSDVAAEPVGRGSRDSRQGTRVSSCL
ncbi:MAG: SEL1-like repeat protein [Pirellulaceae bacterium]